MTGTAGRLLRTIVSVGAAPLAVAVAAQSAGNLLFHAVVGRTLPADSYGALGAVLSAMVMLGVPLGALQAAASALVADAEPARATAARVLGTVAAWSTLPAAVVAAAAPAVRDYFRLGSLLDAAQLAPYLMVAALLATARGLLLGQRGVTVVAATYLVGTGVRLAVGLALVDRYGVGGALLGTLAGELASLAVAGVRLARQPRAASAARRLGLRAVAPATVAVTGLFLFSTVDLLLARHHLHGTGSAEYVAAATVAKTILALPAAIMSAVFPRLVAAWPRPDRLRALVTGGASVTVPALLGAGAVIAVPGLVLRLLYGDGYAAAATLVAVLTGIAALTSLVTLAAYAALARRAAALALPWLGALAEVVLISVRHAGPMEIAGCSAAALVPTLLVVAAVELRAWRRGPGQHLRAWRRGPGQTAQPDPARADAAGEGAGLAPAH